MTKLTAFHRQVDSVMRDNMYDRRIPGFKSGTLHSASLYKAASGNPRLFSRKREQQHRAFEVTMLVDTSGSMNDGMDYVNRRYRSNRITVAANCMLDMAEAFARNQIDLGIITFNGMVVEVMPMGPHRRIQRKELLLKLQDQAKLSTHPLTNHEAGEYYGSPYGCTHTLQGLQLVQELWKRPTRVHGAERILMVYTDGYPGCSSNSCEGGRANIRQRSDVINATWLKLAEKGACIPFILTDHIPRDEEGMKKGFETYFPKTHRGSKSEVRLINNTDRFLKESIEALGQMLVRG